MVLKLWWRGCIEIHSLYKNMTNVSCKCIMGFRSRPVLFEKIAKKIKKTKKLWKVAGGSSHGRCRLHHAAQSPCPLCITPEVVYFCYFHQFMASTFWMNVKI